MISWIIFFELLFRKYDEMKRIGFPFLMLQTLLIGRTGALMNHSSITDFWNMSFISSRCYVLWSAIVNSRYPFTACYHSHPVRTNFARGVFVTYLLGCILPPGNRLLRKQNSFPDIFEAAHYNTTKISSILNGFPAMNTYTNKNKDWCSQI